MRRIALIVTALSTALACGNDPRVIDAPEMTGSEPGVSCPTTTAWLMDCDTSATCMGCRCRPFGHLMYCTQPCIDNTECPAPSAGCVMGFCMRP